MGWEWHCLAKAPVGVDSVGVMRAIADGLEGSVGAESGPDYAFGIIKHDGRELRVYVHSGPNDYMILVDDKTPAAAWEATKSVAAALRAKGWEADDDPGKDQSYCLAVGAYN